MTTSKIVIVSDRMVILADELKPGENTYHLERFIELKKEKEQVALKKCEQKTVTQATDLVNDLKQLPPQRRFACLLKHVLVPLIKPPKGLV